MDGETREVDLTYRDQNTAVVTYSADWQNKRQKAEVNVLKKEKDSDRVLEGAVFALCNKEDIVNAKGDVILKANTVIEEQATDKEGKLTFTADLPLGYTYYVKETSRHQDLRQQIRYRNLLLNMVGQIRKHCLMRLLLKMSRQP